MELISHAKTVQIVLATTLVSIMISGCASNQQQLEEDVITPVNSQTDPNANLPCCAPGTYQPIVDMPATQEPAAPAPAAPDGRPAVQVMAARDINNARVMQQRAISAGYKNAVILQIDGLYKVRIPYNSYEQAKANLPRIANTVAQDAFVAMPR